MTEQTPDAHGMCPTCESPQPHLHPAVQHEGEVQPCGDAFHRIVTPQNPPQEWRKSHQPAPGGERAQDEPITCATPMCGYVVTTVSEFCAICNLKHAAAASPRPAEPEPPKVYEARMLELAKERAELADRVFVHVPHPMDEPPKAEPCRVPPAGWYCTRGAGHDGPCAARPTDGNEQAWEDLAADGGLPESQPKADTGTLEAAVEARIEQAAADAELYGHLYARDALRDALTAESVRGDEGAMRSRLYRLLMRLAHRHNWHYAPPIYPEGDMQLWCKWCGFRQTVKGRRRK